MAERRMFAKTVIDSDAFLDMPVTSQLLYFHLAMRADDEGFVNKPKSIMRICGCKDDDIKLLFAKKFVIPFETGIVVIKHWKIHNYIRKDTFTETKYKEEKSLLELDENNSYREIVPVPSLPCDEPVTGTSTQVRIDKDRIVKGSLEEENYFCASGDARPVQKGPSKTDVNALFDSLWSMYPVKKGKGQVSDAKRKALYTIGRDEMERAIDRYLQELKRDADWRKPQNGSTFFNSGYVDYLDANFTPDADRPQPVRNGGYQQPKHGLDRLMEMRQRGDFD